MRIALTGATGFLGSHTAAALRRAGSDLRLLVRDVAKAERILGPRGAWPCEVVTGDMADRAAMGTFLEGVDAVIHTAALLYGDRSALESNVAGVRNVLDLGIEKGLDPIVYVSTIAAMFPPPGDVFTVDDPVVELASMYGRSKSAGERYARQQQVSGAPVVIVYPGGIHGPDDPGPTEGTKGIRDRVRYGWPRTPGGLPLVDVRDVAEIIQRACVAGRGPKRYMAGGNFLTWMEEADICEEVMQRPVRRVTVPPWMIHAAGATVDFIKWLKPSFDYPLTREAATFVLGNRPCDSSETLRDLDFEFRTPHETLRDTIVWLHRGGYLTDRQAGTLAAV